MRTRGFATKEYSTSTIQAATFQDAFDVTLYVTFMQFYYSTGFSTAGKFNPSRDFPSKHTTPHILYLAQFRDILHSTYFISFTNTCEHTSEQIAHTPCQKLYTQNRTKSESGSLREKNYVYFAMARERKA